MKLTVGRKSVIARNINSILWIIASSLIVYGYVLFMIFLIRKYDRELYDLFIDVNIVEFLGTIIGTTVAIIFIFILLSQIYNLIIGIHYFKKTETIISDSEIIQSIYGFPYSKHLKTIIISDILNVEINQSSIERIFECGNIYIKGYSNSNYSKTNFKLWIYGLDSVSMVKDNIIYLIKKGF